VVSEWLPPRPRPSDAEWVPTRPRFPAGTTVSAPVIARQPFCLFLDLCDDVLGAMKIPSLPARYRPLDARPDLGTRITGHVIGHRDAEPRVALAAADTAT
jgi:hypothetical protein